MNTQVNPQQLFTEIVAQESFKNINAIYHDIEEPTYSFSFSELLALIADMCVSSCYDSVLQQGASDYQQTNLTYQLLKKSVEDSQ